MKHILLLALALSSVAHANFFTDETSLSEASTALAHCNTEAANLVEGSNWIGTVVGVHTELTPGVDQKVYTFSSFKRFGFGGSKPGPVLAVTLTLTQPPEGMMDAPAQAEYSCKLSTAETASCVEEGRSVVVSPNAKQCCEGLELKQADPMGVGISGVCTKIAE